MASPVQAVTIPLADGWKGLSFYLPEGGIAPVAANDLAAVGAGRVAARLALRFVPYIGTAIVLYELYEMYRGYSAWFPSQGYAANCRRPPPWPPGYIATDVKGSVSPWNCVGLNNQFYGGPGPITNQPYIQTWVNYNTLANPFGLMVAQDARFATNPAVNYNGQPVAVPYTAPVPVPGGAFVPKPGVDWQPNPNVVRTPLRDPRPDLDPRDDPNRDERPDNEIERLRNNPRETEYRPGERPINRPLNPSPPSPPRKGEKERKVRSMGAQIFRVLDGISEGADVIDAIYEALPDKVKKKWKKKFRPTNTLGLDAAGQYGIANADWKLQAIWHNMDKLDVIEAIKNVVANEVEDKVLGRLHRARDATRPRNVLKNLQRRGLRR